MYREILTKAVIAKGETTISEKEEINTTHNISKVLGCWIINHEYELSSQDNKVFINGHCDSFLWYGLNNNTDSDLIKKTFNYQKEIPYSFTLESFPLTNQNEIKSQIINEPYCVSMTFNNQNINIEYKIKVAIEIIGETKIKIKVDDVIIDDKIDTNYMKDS